METLEEKKHLGRVAALEEKKRLVRLAALEEKKRRDAEADRVAALVSTDLRGSLLMHVAMGT